MAVLVADTHGLASVSDPAGRPTHEWRSSYERKAPVFLPSLLSLASISVMGNVFPGSCETPCCSMHISSGAKD